MARARTSGGMAIWALTLFVIAFFFALVMAIIFAGQKADAEERATQATAKFAKAATENEMVGVTLKPGQTVVGHYKDENVTLKRMISSQPELSADAIDKMRLERNIERALFDEVTHLNNELNAALMLASQAQQAQQKAEQNAATAQQEKNNLSTQYNSSVAALNSQIKTVKDAFEQYRKDITGSDTQLSNKLAELRRGKDQEIAQQGQAIRQKDSESARLLNELNTLRNSMAAAVGVENIVPADGEITALVGEKDQVYISLGTQEHVLLGMTFEVFGTHELVKTDEYEQLRGKATLEVIYVDGATALARVVRRGYRSTLQPGDKIVNLIFDPQKTYKFHIYGDFDINHNGTATENELKIVQSKVRRWGGELTDVLTYDVDYLVLGLEPPLPDVLTTEVLDPELIATNVAQKQAYEQYQTLIGEANKLSIPVLNQNRFLALTGHYER